MMTIATALAALDTQRDNLAANLTTKGVTAANTETLSQLVPKVLDITGGETPTDPIVPVELRSVVSNVVIIASATTGSIVLPSNIVVGDLILIGFFVRSAVTLPDGYTLIGQETNGSAGQITYLIYKIATSSDASATVVITQSTAGRINISAVVLKCPDGFAIGTAATTSNGTATVATIPKAISEYNGCLAVLVSSRVIMATTEYSVSGSGWTPTTTIDAVADMRLMMGINLLDAYRDTSIGTISSGTDSQYMAQVLVILSPLNAPEPRIPSTITSGVVILGVSSDGRPMAAAVYGESIYDSMFSCDGYDLLSLLRFESEVATIGSRAFEGCASLALTELPETITSIDTYAFYGCSKLALTQLPSALSEIPSSAFRNCPKLCLTALPDSLQGTIGSYAFSNDSALAITSIPIGVTKIDTYAFMYCTGIENLHIRNGATTYDTTPFGGCSGLKSITVGDVGSPVTAITNAAFSATGASGLTINVYCADPATPPTGSPWGAPTETTVNFLQA